MKSYTNQIFRYIEQHEKYGLDMPPETAFLGHPMNSFNLIKHVAYGWAHFENLVLPQMDTFKENLDKIANRKAEKLPDDYDITGAAFAMVRLISKYRVDVEALAHSGVIKATFGGTDHKVSKPCASLPTGESSFLKGRMQFLMEGHKFAPYE